ncbi:peptide-methionine (S)-S-oxide reductase MsrA [uncultured Alsobacter sp.]|uniref:peptide-methionine (S)-S-oxide reductase MsrA n=1 Tax=uncultured Alsobacter sp. TaxID=1748258 RepID=UPI0025D340FD|nr:peptide-methionine (S)-S-oxide reductase MsrA [uncultured Alsobacter sp.]
MLVNRGASAEDFRLVPAVALDEAVDAPGTRTAVFAGGCFWGVQGVFQHVEGVVSAVSGYAGGQAATAHYDMVGSGRTGHAEAVEVVYDPRKVTYGDLLRIFFSVAHDPTQLDRQGPDHGPQYRSAIFPRSADQTRVAKAYIEQLGRDHAFHAPIVTRIEADKAFYPAEAYHQDFLELNPGYPYIVINDLPKVAALQTLFPRQYRAKPVLVSAKAGQ